MSIWLKILTLTILVVFAAGGKIRKRNINTDSKFKVIGPAVQPHEAYKFRYQVSLQHKCGHFCGGIILTDRLIITAAHCVKNKEPKNLSIMAETTDLKSKDAQWATVFSYIMHRGYTRSPAYDIALILLREKLDLSGLTKVTLPQFGQNFMGKFAKASGWGGQTQNLTYTIMKVVDREFCHDESRLCADPFIAKTQTIFGDSGGPLVLYNNNNTDVTLIGIASAINIDLYIFANVANLIPWLEEAVVEANYLFSVLESNYDSVPKTECS